MLINFFRNLRQTRQAQIAREIIARPYPALNLEPCEKTLISRYNAARGGNFNADDLKDATYGQAASLAGKVYANKRSAFETLSAYLAGKWGKLQLEHQQLETERGHLERQRDEAASTEFNDFNEYNADNWFVRFIRALAPLLGMLLVIGLSTILDYAINSSRVTIINNSRLSTVLLTKNDLLLSNLSVIAISLINNLAPFIAGMAYQRKVRGKYPVSIAVFIVLSLLIACFVNAIIPVEMFGLPNATMMQKLMSLLPYGTSFLGFLLPILVAKDRKKTVDECDAELTDHNKKAGSVWKEMQRINGEQKAAADRLNTDYVAAQKAYFSAIDALFCRFTSNHTNYRSAPTGNRTQAIGYGDKLPDSTASSFTLPPSDKL